MRPPSPSSRNFGLLDSNIPGRDDRRDDRRGRDRRDDAMRNRDDPAPRNGRSGTAVCIGNDASTITFGSLSYAKPTLNRVASNVLYYD